MGCTELGSDSGSGSASARAFDLACARFLDRHGVANPGIRSRPAVLGTTHRAQHERMKRMGLIKRRKLGVDTGRHRLAGHWAHDHDATHRHLPRIRINWDGTNARQTGPIKHGRRRLWQGRPVSGELMSWEAFESSLRLYRTYRFDLRGKTAADTTPCASSMGISSRYAQRARLSAAYRNHHLSLALPPAHISMRGVTCRNPATSLFATRTTIG